MSSSQVASHQPDDTPPNEKSQFRMIKEAGFNNMHDFMISHGLKPYIHEDYGEASQILDTMRRYDQEYWEAEQQERYQEPYEDQEAGCGEPGLVYQEYWETELDIQDCENWEEKSVQFYHDLYEGYEADQNYPDYEDYEADTSEPVEAGYAYSDSGINDSFCDYHYD
ncbi:hypothetical protein ASPBRDRAFT_512211 [Aspergillus brasiliensis CBS 101740]|uniref:Uncharacterized protein n=1 Tax=Aspergillus brasiliensis (strain CBS 101740 / IMI 381727 / IBT 21946) TaxID=767769 RepID=A0A1L9UQ87_ASPBC|nr:hypothetical protein ASPBRDRAFT_512211 [Aspergillus brasiliensis CBS 101740]